MNSSSLDITVFNRTDLPTSISAEMTVSAAYGNESLNLKCEPIYSVPLAILSGVVASATILANVLVILAILRGSKHFQRPIYWVIIHLSVADIIVGIMLLWNYCFSSLLDIHNTLRSLQVIFSIWISSEASSTLGFVLLAVDRYVQIFHKHFHRIYATRVTVGICIAFAWTFSIGLFTIAPSFNGWLCFNCTCPEKHYMQCHTFETCSQIVPPFQKRYTLAIAVLLFVCLPIPVFIYCTIFFKVRKTSPRVRPNKRRPNMRLIKTLSVILIVFILTLSPVAVLLVVDYVHKDYNDDMISIALYIYVLAFLNSLANPLLYIWRMTAIRDSIRKMICFTSVHRGLPSRKEFTSNNSDNRSPIIKRPIYKDASNIDVNEIPHNNNKPFTAILCLRQIKRGRYSNSRTSTPLSDRPCHNRLRESARISRDIDRELESDNAEQDCLNENYTEKREEMNGGCAITEL